MQIDFETRFGLLAKAEYAIRSALAVFPEFLRLYEGMT